MFFSHVQAIGSRLLSSFEVQGLKKGLLSCMAAFQPIVALNKFDSEY